MPKLSWCILIYGVILIAADVADASLSLHLSLPNVLSTPIWAAGMITIAAGLAAAQRRRGMRRTGTLIGLVLPIVYAWVFGSQVINGRGLERPAIMALTALSLLSFAEIVMVLKLRPREGVASRGYAVPLTSPKPNSPVQPGSVKQPSRRSEAG